MKAWTRILNPANVPCNGRLLRPLFCKVEITEDGKLSITGVIDPWTTGNAGGGCGQINMEFSHRKPEDNDRRTSKPIAPEEMVFTEGWDREKWLDFLDVWEQWHLNDMRPGCEHQTAEGWGKEEIELVTYHLTAEALREQNQAREQAMAQLEAGETVTLAPGVRDIILLPYTTHTPPDVDSPGSGRYEVVKREQKTSGWVRQEEHPRGVLGKPCPVCGYKYGSEWRKEKLPAKVVAFLKSLPETTVTPAWV